MKKKLLIFCMGLTMLILIFVFNPVFAEEVDQEIELDEYVSEYYRLNYDSDLWEKTEIETDFPILDMSKFDILGSSGNVNIIIQETPFDNETYLNISRQEYEMILDDFEMHEDIACPGEFYRQFTYSGIMEETDLKFKQFVGVKEHEGQNNLAFLITYAAYVEHFDDYIEEVVILADNFQMK